MVIYLFMDIELVIGIERVINNLFIPDLANIILGFLGIDNIYNQIIEHNIVIQNRLSRRISIEIEIEFQIDYHTQYTLSNITEHCDHNLIPEFIDITYNNLLELDFQIEIRYENWIWELFNIEPDFY